MRQAHGLTAPAPATGCRVPAPGLARLVDRALARRDVPVEHRGFVVDGLVETSLRGVDTHGVRLLPTYLAELDGGRAKAHPELTWVARSGAAASLDAGDALGMVAGSLAAREAVALARVSGVGAVAVASSNHFGAAAVYTLAMARRDCVGLAFSNSDALVAPFGGVRPLFGTNPLSLAARGADGEMFCADLATSQVSYSRVKRCRETGEALRPGWALAADGTDAAGDAAATGDDAIAALQPLGGHKGQCLGMIVEVLTALLAGGPLDAALSHLYRPPYDAPRRISHLMLALDPAAFGDPVRFRRRLAALLAAVRDEPAATGATVCAPGDPESAAAAERTEHGIPLSEDERRVLAVIDAEDSPAERLGL